MNKWKGQVASTENPLLRNEASSGALRSMPLFQETRRGAPEVGDYSEALRRASRKAMSWASPGEERRALAIFLSRRRSCSDAT